MDVENHHLIGYLKESKKMADKHMDDLSGFSFNNPFKRRKAFFYWLGYSNACRLAITIIQMKEMQR